MNSQAAIVMGLLAEDREVISYRKNLNHLTGSVTATILLQQIIFRAKGKGWRPFFKFRKPCKHALYKEGDSWTEELGFSGAEFDTAISKIGTKVTHGMDKNKAYSKTDRTGFVVYWTDANRVTWYHLNFDLVANSIMSNYQLIQESGISKLNNVELPKTEITTETTSESSELTLATQENGESKDSIKDGTQSKTSDSTSDVSEPDAESGESVLAAAFPESQKLYEQRQRQSQNGDKPQGWLQGLPAGIRRIREADWQIRRPEVEQLIGEFIEVTGLFPQGESVRNQWIAAGNKQLKDYGVQTLVTDGLYRQAWEAIEADRKETGKKLSITSPYSIGFKLEEILQERAKAGDEDLTEAEMKRLGEVFRRMKAEDLIVQAGMVWVVRADDTKLRSRSDFLAYADRLGW